MAAASDRIAGRHVSSIGSGPRLQLAEVVTAAATNGSEGDLGKQRMENREGCVSRLEPQATFNQSGNQSYPTGLRSKPNRQAEHENHGHSADHVVPEFEGRIYRNGRVGGDGSLQAGNNGSSGNRDKRDEGHEDGITIQPGIFSFHVEWAGTSLLYQRLTAKRIPARYTKQPGTHISIPPSC